MLWVSAGRYRTARWHGPKSRCHGGVEPTAAAPSSVRLRGRRPRPRLPGGLSSPFPTSMRSHVLRNCTDEAHGRRVGGAGEETGGTVAKRIQLRDPTSKHPGKMASRRPVLGGIGERGFLGEFDDDGIEATQAVAGRGSAGGGGGASLIQETGSAVPEDGWGGVDSDTGRPPVRPSGAPSRCGAPARSPSTA